MALPAPECPPPSFVVPPGPVGEPTAPVGEPTPPATPGRGLIADRPDGGSGVSADPVDSAGPNGDAAPADADERAATVDRVCDAFRGFMRALHAPDRPGWDDLDLTMSQLKTVMLVVESGGLSGRELAERLGTGAPAVTAQVDRLVQRGYVRREEDPADRRITWARPTEKARTLFDRLHATHRERLSEVLRELSDDRLDLVARAVALLEAAAARRAAGRTGAEAASPARCESPGRHDSPNRHDRTVCAPCP